jgi:hypothetical protein
MYWPIKKATGRFTGGFTPGIDATRRKGSDGKSDVEPSRLP